MTTTCPSCGQAFGTWEPSPQGWRCTACGTERVAPTVRAVSGAALEALERDAARYQYLRTYAQARSLGMDGRADWYIQGIAIQRRARTFDEAVDRAIQDARDGPRTRERPC